MKVYSSIFLFCGLLATGVFYFVYDQKHTIDTEIQHDASLLQETVETLVLAKDVRAEGAATVIEVDPVEWLQGEAVYEAAAEDAACSVENADECMPSLYNNFYIRNARLESVTYAIASDAKITIIEGSSPVPAAIGEVDARLEAHNPLPFMIKTRGGVVTALEEMYMP